MFFLWSGVMAGILLAYLVMRYGNRSDVRRGAHKSLRDSFDALWPSLRWRFAAVVALLLIVPVPVEFILTGFFGSFGLLEAFKTVLLPWIAGVGFGIWIYATIARGARNADQGHAGARSERVDGGREGAQHSGEDAGDAHSEQGNGGRKADPEKAEIGRELSFIPIAVAMLAVAFMISDQQYGWLARLQKLSFGGSGVEFAPRSAGGQQEAARGGPTPGGDVIGEDRVSALVDFMAKLNEVIGRDLTYFQELGYQTDDLRPEWKFAEEVVVPMGKHLQIFHGAHAYNNLGLLLDRDFVDAIRSFARYRSNAGDRSRIDPETQKDLAEKVRDKIKAAWGRICEREKMLPGLGVVSPEDLNKVKSCPQTQGSTDAWLSSNAGTGFNYVFPYGTLFAAMLLNAADEQDSAIKDLDEWVANNNAASDDTAATRRGKSWLVFRATNQAMSLLLIGESSKVNSYLLLEHAQTLAKIGQELLRSDAVPDSDGSGMKKLSWQDQSDRVAKAGPVAPIWELGNCPSGLTESFKRAMLATERASNNVAFIFSQNLEYANRHDGIRDMEDRAKELAKVNTRCLAVKEDSDSLNILKGQQAAFFDTVATVQLALAARETNQQEKRRRLCDAYMSASRAITLQEKTFSTQGSSFTAGLDRVKFLEKWTEYRQELTAHIALAAYDRSRGEASSQLAELGYRAPGDCL
jgi:hypothetical protein